MSAPSPDPLFATAPDRSGTGSEKWDRYAGRDVIPTWVADMDFAAPDVVLDAIRSRVDHGVFGYTDMPPGFAPALCQHLERRHGWHVEPDWITSTPGVVNGLAITARLCSKPGDGIISFTPVYPPFLSLPGLAGLESIRVPLAESATAWTIDWDHLDASITPTTKLFWLCHPHNPTGTVFGKAELLRLAEFAARHDLTVVSDEIWSDLLLDEDHGGSRHVPFGSLDHAKARDCITLVAPSKTWNLAGLGCAAAICRDRSILKNWRVAGGGLVPMITPLGYAAAEAAWQHGEAWRQRLVVLLRQHRELAAEAVAAIPGLAAVRPESTFLFWINCRGTGVADPQAACEAAGIGPSDGKDFGFPGFLRLNTGCPTDRFQEILRRLSRAFHKPPQS